MEPLLEAIRSKCAADATIIAAFPPWTDTASNTVSYYADLAPARAPFPYLVSTVIAAPATQGYGVECYAVVTIQFAAYDADHAGLYTKMKAFTTVFDNLTLTLSSGKHTNVTRTSQPIPVLQPDTDEHGTPVWAWIVTYDFSISH